MKNKRFVIGNWKMNPVSLSEAKKIFSGIKRFSKKYRKVKTIICPPFIFASELAKSADKNLGLGAQDVFYADSGAYTGEISPLSLKSLRIEYVIVGHSERRALGESDEEVSKKIAVLLKYGLTPVLCIGESERDSHGEYLSFLKDQLLASLAGVSRKDISKIIIAYEPVWAIGKSSSEAVTPAILHEMSIFIRKLLMEKLSVIPNNLPPLIYGGSVDASNAEEIAKDGDISGFLVGRASLEPKQFEEIAKTVNAFK